MKAPVDDHSRTSGGDLDPATNSSSSILYSVVFSLLALYMGLVIVHGWWKKWKASSSHGEQIFFFWLNDTGFSPLLIRIM